MTFSKPSPSLLLKLSSDHSYFGLFYHLGHLSMVKLKRKLLATDLAWRPCLKMIGICRELYKTSRFVDSYMWILPLITELLKYGFPSPPVHVMLCRRSSYSLSKKENKQTNTLNLSGREGVWIVLFSEVTPFEDLILSSIVANVVVLIHFNF